MFALKHTSQCGGVNGEGEGVRREPSTGFKAVTSRRLTAAGLAAARQTAYRVERGRRLLLRPDGVAAVPNAARRLLGHTEEIPVFVVQSAGPRAFARRASNVEHLHSHHGVTALVGDHCNNNGECALSVSPGVFADERYPANCVMY